MTTTEKNQSEIINAWQSLIEQSVKANTAFLEEYSKIFSTLLSKKTEPKDLLKINTEFLKAATNNFIKLNVTNSENLMNFGVSVSRNIFSFIDKINKKDVDTSQHIESGVTNTRNQINLSVKQGEQITTSFYLNSHNAFSQTGNFHYENFTDETTGEKAAISMSISPKEFTLESGKSIKVDVSVGVTNDTAPGKYKAIVRLNGMDNQEFDIVAEVIENKLQVKQVVKSKAALKKIPAKKSSAKKGRQKADAKK
ncbi:MAG: hypothetical protein ABI472_11150 [Ginsengibacter sp.]